MRISAYPEIRKIGTDGLEELPNHWNLIRGRFVMSVNPAAPNLRKLNPEDEVSFIPMDAVGEYGGLNTDQSRVIDDVSTGYTEFQDGDVIIAKITPCFENGKAALVDGLMNGAAYGTTELHVLRAGPSLDRGYLFYTAISDRFSKLGESEMYGAGGQKRVPPEFCKDFPLPIPTVPEQQQIAAFLDWKTGQIDALIARKKELLEKLKEKRLAVITHAVTKGLNPKVAMRDSRIPWLGEVPEHWEVKRLKFQAEDGRSAGIQIGPFGGMLTDLSYADSGEFKLYGQENVLSGDFNKGRRWITEDQTSELIQYRAQEGDFLFTRKGSIGGCAVFPRSAHPGIIDSDTIRLRVNSRMLSTRFLVHAFRESDYLQYQVQLLKRGAILSGLNTTTIADLVLATPPIEEQNEIADYLDAESAKLNMLQEKVIAAIDRLTEYRTALITAATTGKIDVRKLKIPRTAV